MVSISSVGNLHIQVLFLYNCKVEMTESFHFLLDKLLLNIRMSAADLFSYYEVLFTL